MKNYSTQLYLQHQLTAIQFLEYVAKVHCFSIQDLDLSQYKIKISPQVTIYHYMKYQTIVIQIDDENHIEYIYNENNQGLCIHASQQTSHNPIIDDFIKHHMIKNDGCLPITHKPICIQQQNIHQIIDFLENHHAQLPIIYINYQQTISPSQIASQLSGIAHVLYEENQNISYRMKRESTNIPQHGKIAIYFLNNDYKTYHPLRNESSKAFSQRIIHNIEVFLKQRQYGFPFDFHLLQKKHIEDLKHEASHLEQDTIYQLDKRMQRLEEEKRELMEKLDKLENEILILQNQNDYLNSELSAQNEYSLLQIGKIEEFYAGEQKDMVLELLEDELKRKHIHNDETDMIQDILDFNPKEGIREEYLNQIFKIMVSGHDLDKLKNYGITFKYNGNHLIAVFFKNSRYQSTISSTPSDLNSYRQAFRQFRNNFF